ncbi:MAG: mobile mystery protein A [Candidatus Krumholzibacteria bacterium]|nr:mobile mystery protein A [Candidatus Krumholzibacteria bacterium]
MTSGSTWKKAMAREQLDKRLKKYQWLRDFEIPPKGWIKALRFALGMNGNHLAIRLGVSKQNISQIENGELEGSVSLKMMRRIGEALDCRFVYGFIPNSTLEETVRNRAEHVAWAKLERVNQSMRLEAQDISEKDVQRAWKLLVSKLLIEMPSNLWDGD